MSASGDGEVFAGDRFAVVGLGRNGGPVADALAAMGARVWVWDDRVETRLASPHAILPEPFNLSRFTALVLSPGIPHAREQAHPAAEAARAAGVPIISDAELLYRATRRRGSKARFAGVTGTNGKSTTTAMLQHVLVSAGRDSVAGGNLGRASLALPALGDDGVYVLEMSSYMLERLTSLRFDVACLLNLSPDHLDRHGNMAGYVAAKRHIFDRQTKADTAVLGVDDPMTAAIADAGTGLAARIVRISGERAADLWCEAGTLVDHDGPILAMANLPALPGVHNAQNAAAVAAMALTLGIGRTAVASGIASFPGLPHRQQRIAVIDGVLWINDSKATNADAAARALACYDRVVWIAGGIAKEGGIEALAPWFPRIQHALLIGRDAPSLSSTLRRAGVKFTMSGTLESAVASARAMARRLDAQAVLLSPACASFDQFSGFEARGERFAELVQAGSGALR